jgi:hypothetical protein
MPLVVAARPGTNYTTWPRTLAFSAAYAVPSRDDPQDTAAYVVDYGDGTTANMTFAGVGCPTDGAGSCMAGWEGPDHTFTEPNLYVARLLRNGSVIDTTRFLAFASDISSQVSGTAAPSRELTGSPPLTVSFSFTGGSEIDFADGTPPQKLCDCPTWSTAHHQLEHTYTCPGSFHPLVSFQGFGMEGAEISVLKHP